MNIVVSDDKLRSMNSMTLSSRHLYLIMIGYRVMGRVNVHYDELIEYAHLTKKTITKAISELVDNKYIAIVGKGMYKIL